MFLVQEECVCEGDVTAHVASFCDGQNKCEFIAKKLQPESYTGFEGATCEISSDILSSKYSQFNIEYQCVDTNQMQQEQPESLMNLEDDGDGEEASGEFQMRQCLFLQRMRDIYNLSEQDMTGSLHRFIALYSQTFYNSVCMRICLSYVPLHSYSL